MSPLSLLTAMGEIGPGGAIIAYEQPEGLPEGTRVYAITDATLEAVAQAMISRGWTVVPPPATEGDQDPPLQDAPALKLLDRLLFAPFSVSREEIITVRNRTSELLWAAQVLAGRPASARLPVLAAARIRNFIAPIS